MDRVDPVVYCRPGYFADQRRGVDRFEKNGMKIYRAPATIYFGEEPAGPPAIPAPASRRRLTGWHVCWLVVVVAVVAGGVLLAALHGLGWAVVGLTIWSSIAALYPVAAWIKDVV